MSKTTIPTGGITADAIDATLIADDAISEEHLDATAITGHTALAESPADTDEFLISDGGTLKRLDAQYIGGGALNFVSSTTIGDGVANFYVNNCFSSTYQNYMVILQNVRADADCNLRMRFVSGGSFDNTSNAYRFAGTGFDRGGSSRTFGGAGDSFRMSYDLDGDDAASQHFGIFYLAAPYISSSRKRITGHYNNSHISGNSIDATYNFAGTFEKSSYQAEGMFFFPDSGNFRTGNVSEGHGLVKVYGISDS